MQKKRQKGETIGAKATVTMPSSLLKAAQQAAKRQYKTWFSYFRRALIAYMNSKEGKV